MARIAGGADHEGEPSVIAGQSVTYSQVAILATRGVVMAAVKLYADYYAWAEASGSKSNLKH